MIWRIFDVLGEDLLLLLLLQLAANVLGVDLGGEGGRGQGCNQGLVHHAAARL